MPCKKGVSGRPRVMTPDDVTIALQKVADGGHLRAISAEFGIAASTLCGYLIDTGERYDRALLLRGMKHVDEMREFMDDLIKGDMDVAVYREVKDSIKWLAGKEIPQRYGDRKEYNVKVQNITDLLEGLPDD